MYYKCKNTHEIPKLTDFPNWRRQSATSCSSFEAANINAISEDIDFPSFPNQRKTIDFTLDRQTIVYVATCFNSRVNV